TITPGGTELAGVVETVAGDPVRCGSGAFPTAPCLTPYDAVIPQQESDHFRIRVQLGTGAKGDEGLERDVDLDVARVTFPTPPDERLRSLPEGYTYRIGGDGKVTATATPGITRIAIVFGESAVQLKITAPPPISVGTVAGRCDATITNLGTPTVSNPNAIITRQPSGDVFAKGITSVTWRASDATGNAATAIQKVTVSDQEQPSIAAPADVNVGTDLGK